MGSPLAANVADTLWLPLVFVLFGAAIATALVTRLRLPAHFWLPLVFAGTGLTSYVLFYVWLFDTTTGRQASWCAPILGALAFAWQCRQANVRRFLKQRDVWLPGLLLMLIMAAYLCVLAWPQTLVNYRFKIPLPPEDNIAPRLLADRLEWGLFKHSALPPLITDFRSSDRPPLQAAVTLAMRPWHLHRNDWTYQIIGLICQLGWIPALYALARTIGFDRRRMIIVLFACATSGFFFVNSIYVWPKLFAATLFLTGLTLLLHLRILHPRPDETRQTAWIVPLAAMLFALSLLAHGGPFFSLIALPVFAALLRPWPRIGFRTVVLAGAIGATLLAPWLAYQRFYDPPGDRMLKIHLAGVTHVNVTDNRTFWRALGEEYGKLTLERYLAGRWSNVKEQFLVFGKAPPFGWVYWVQWQQFIHHLPGLGLLLIGFAALLRPRWWRDRDWSAAMVRRLLAYTVAALAIWIVLMLAPESAMVHHSSFATTALLFFCASACLANLPNTIVVPTLTLHVLLSARVWAAWPLAPPVPLSMLQELSPWYLWMAALFLAAFAICLRFIPDARSDSDAQPPHSPSGPAPSQHRWIPDVNAL
jgi:hypothetical protein